MKKLLLVLSLATVIASTGIVSTTAVHYTQQDQPQQIAYNEDPGGGW